MTIGVFLISDCRLAVWGLERLLETEPLQFSSAGAAFVCDPPALEAAAKAAPDVVLLDIDSDPANVLPFIGRLQEVLPRAKILLLTRLGDSALQDCALLMGARGVIDKSTAPDQLLSALVKVHEDQIWLDRDAVGRLFVEFSRMSKNPAQAPVQDQFASLTEREQQIVTFIAGNSGQPGKTLATKLHISESTLRNHLTTIYEKLGVANRTGLVAYAFQNGLDKHPAK